MAPTILWFRRDLRLSDNPALLAALEAGGDDGVVPLFVVDPRLFEASGDARRAHLVDALHALDDQLGGQLLVRRGDPVEEVVRVARHHGAEAVYAAHDFGPYGHARDEAVAAALAAAGARLVSVGSPYAVEPGTIVNGSGEHFKVFTPFSRAWAAHGWDPPAPAPRSPRFTKDLAGTPIPARPRVEAEVLEAGEAAALAQLDRFLDRAVDAYDERRDLPAEEGTSRLSVHLKYGTVHPRTILARLGRSKGAQTFRSELCWRDFYADVLWHRPDTVVRAFNPAMRAMQVDEGPTADERFAAWAEGRTGYPIVDAGMRQLQQQAWVHNRVRMIVASFLVKDLHVDWTRGAKLFMQRLQDGDLASNHHGWQWVAGTGTDAAPFFRIFNPTSQGKRFDPRGEYVARFVPALAGLPPGDRHEPWVARAKGADLGGYPEPIVDHAAEREEALRRYAALRGG